MALEIVDPGDFLSGGAFSEKVFLERAEARDWSEYRDRKVLVRGCSSTIVPPWAFMMITARLTPYARTIRFGNEHDNVLVFRRSEGDKPKERTDEQYA